MILYAATQRRIFRIPLENLAKVLGVVCRFYFNDDEIAFNAKDPVVAKVCVFHCLIHVLI